MNFLPSNPSSSLISPVFRLLVAWLAICLMLSQFEVSPAAGQETEPQAADEKIELPKNQKEPVFIYDNAGGFRRIPKKHKDFQVFADGRVLATNDDGAREIQLDDDQLQELLQFVVNQHNALKYSTEGLVAEMKKVGKLPQDQIADATSAEVSINLPKGKNSFSVYALFLAQKQFPKIKGIHDLAAIKKKVGQLVAIDVLGDRKQKILDFVNAEIKKQGLKLKPVSIKDLSGASEFKNGGFQANFQRPQPNPENTNSAVININYYQKSKEDQPVVRVFGLQRE
ncbi:MAG: hypothetical protein AAFN77_21930 [Planctomycetota bacterium]